MTGPIQVRLSSKARQTAAIMLIAIICIFISQALTTVEAADYPPTGNQSPRIIDHAMAGSVEELSMEAIDRREAFFTSDIKACSWISVGDILSKHLAEWKWYSPDGGLYQTRSREIPLPSSDFWNWYNVYSCMDIAGSDASKMPGSWHVDIYLDDKKILTEQFMINPSKDLSYSSTTQGGCYTDTKTGQVVCIDKTGDSSASGESASGESASGESISGESDQSEVQGGCYVDPATGAVVCVDVFGNPYSQDGSFGPEETEGYSQLPSDAGLTGETETMEPGGSSQGASTEDASPNDNASVKESYVVLASAAQAIDSGNIEAFLQSLSNETRSGVRGDLDFSTPEAGKMALGLRDAKPKEIVADLVVYEMTIDATTYSFNAIREDGAWKISGL